MLVQGAAQRVAVDVEIELALGDGHREPAATCDARCGVSKKAAVEGDHRDLGRAVDAALRAISKGDTVRYWQKVFGPSFDV